MFDEEADNRFLPLAQSEGLNLGPEDFSDPEPHGVHLLRVQWFPTAGCAVSGRQRPSPPTCSTVAGTVCRASRTGGVRAAR